MKKIIFTLSMATLSVVLIGQKISTPYLDQSGNECVLTWNKETGMSKLFYYDMGDNKYKESEYQLSKRSSTDRGRYGLMPFLDQNGRESILSWNTETGFSRLYYYEESSNKFIMTTYQLPTNPIGDKGKFGFVPYLGKNGEERILAWNSETGLSKLYYYSESKNKFMVSPYQLPTKPTGDKGTYGFKPYLDKDGSECILAWNTTTGLSKLYHYNSSENKFKATSFQLPTRPVGDRGVYGFTAYLDKKGVECALVWNAETGVSRLYYHSGSTNQFKSSPYQLPSKPTGDKGKFGFATFLDRYGAECIMVWNTTTGVSKLYRYDVRENNFLTSSYQLLTIE